MSKIEWTQETWNPIVGCSVTSPGCTNCYAMRQAHRLASNPATPHYHGTTQMTRGGPVFTGKVALAPEKVLTAPLRRRKPTTYFVNSMGDLFHENVPDEWIDRVFSLMARSPQHVFQVLTKRADRMRTYMQSCQRGADDTGGIWPLPNVWLGVSAEDQTRANERIPDLLASPAAVRFVSAEPLLGPVDIRFYLYEDALSLRHAIPPLDWVIVGGESGPGARPMHPDWARSLRDQCNAAGTAFFFKQWGDLMPISEDDHPLRYTNASGTARSITATMKNGDKQTWVRLGKKAAGRLLDGRAWNQMPEPR